MSRRRNALALATDVPGQTALVIVEPDGALVINPEAAPPQPGVDAPRAA